MPEVITIKVSDQTITYDIMSVVLDQHVDDHHVLTAEFRRMDDFDPGSGDHIARYVDLLGKPLSFEMESDDVQSLLPVKMEFIGIVTDVQLENSIDGLGYVKVVAHSPTIQLGGAKRNAIYLDQKASDIISEVLKRHSITLGEIESTSDTLAYCVQYRETDYDFVMRLAASNGLFAFYDGKKFRVCKAASAQSDAPSLPYGSGLRHFNIGYGTTVEKFSGQAYDILKKEVHSGETTGSLQASLSGLPKKSHDASKELYRNDSFVPGLGANSQGAIDRILQVVREGSVGKMITCEGSSWHPLVAAGRCVQIEALGDLGGLYWISSVKHAWKAGEYINTFTGTPLDTAYPSQKWARPPFTDLQSALVVSTDDPDALGRVKVKFNWFESDGDAAEPEKWVRVLTPHAGQEKGFFCLPEIDDEVLVAFEHGNPDRPLVLGSLYNGMDRPPNSDFDGAENNVKRFLTKSGNEIIFKDDSGSEEITITQEGGQNTITLTLDGPKITIETDGDLSLKGKTVSIESTGQDVTVKSAGALKMESTTDTEVKAGLNLKCEGSMNVDVEGGMGATLKGMTTTVEGSAMTTIKGSLVKIN